jgi:hypothetical protein
VAHVPSEPDTYRIPLHTFPRIPDTLNWVPREEADLSEEWSVGYPVNRVWPYLSWLAGERYPRMIRLVINTQRPTLSCWPNGTGPL